MFSVTSSCAQHLYALKILRAHGMFDEALQQIFRAVVISSMLRVERMVGIHISRWQHLEAFLRRSMCSCLCSLEQEDLTELVEAADDTTMKFATVPPYYRSYHGNTAFIAIKY